MEKTLMNRKFLFVVATLVLVVSGLIYIQVWKTNASAPLSNKPQNREIMNTLEKGYSALAYASETSDVSQLAEVFLDNSDYKPSDDVKKNVEEIFGEDVSNKAGYLTSMQAKYLSRGKALKDIQTAMDKAKAENRTLTKEEFQQVIKNNNGVIPPNGYVKSPSGKTQLNYDKIQINGDKAIVYYDDGAAYQKATLTWTNEKWYITNIEALRIHF